MASNSATRGKKYKQSTIVAGGQKPRVRKASHRDFTKKRQEAFLEILSETCNVRLACRESGVPVSVVYKRKEKDAGFRRAWAEALATAYRALELVLLERSFAGTEKVVTRKDGSEERVREYPNAIALQLLKMHRDTVIESEREFEPAEIDEIKQRLLAKLDRLKKRHEGDAP